MFDVPVSEPDRVAAGLRLLDAYLNRHRGKHVSAGDLECELDEAIAGKPLYEGEPDLPQSIVAE